MPRLPISTAQLPKVTEDMPEDTPFKGIVRKLEESANSDKNGRNFLGAEFEIVDDDTWKGKKVTDNYIVLPTEDDVRTLRGAEIAVRLSRLAASCGNKDVMDTDDLIGEIAMFTVKMEEYPEGTGRKMAKVADYYI